LQDKSINPEVANSVAYVGGGGPRFFLSLSPIDADPHVAFLVVNTQENKQVPAMIERTRNFARDNLPEARTRVKGMWLGATETGLFEIRVSGPAFEVLREKTSHLMRSLHDIPGTVDIMQDWENRILKIDVRVDQARARRSGVTSSDVANSLNALVSGANVTDYRKGDEVIPIILRGTEADRTNISNIKSLSIYSRSRGTNVPLSQIADIEATWDLYRIKRRGQQRTVTISAKHQFLKAGQIYEALKPAIVSLDLPPGYEWELGGELEQSAKAQRYLFANMPFAAAGIIFLLVWQFNSFRRAGIILLTIPLTFIGAVIGLIVTSGRARGIRCDYRRMPCTLSANSHDDGNHDTWLVVPDRVGRSVVLRHGSCHRVRSWCGNRLYARCRPGSLCGDVSREESSERYRTDTGAGCRGITPATDQQI
jgi:multidrug efflux pump subunit AcrB